MITANGSVVTIKDSAGNGAISSASAVAGAINDGTLIIEGGTFTSTDDTAI